jgi:hypothetical protein
MFTIISKPAISRFHEELDFVVVVGPGVDGGFCL